MIFKEVIKAQLKIEQQLFYNSSEYNNNLCKIQSIRIIYNNTVSTKMANTGYDKDRFPNLNGQIFDCIICSCVVKNPKQCTGCGNLFCGLCIDDWMKKNASCPNRCVSSINPMTSKALLGIYNDLDIKCDKGCGKALKLLDLPKHEQSCGKPKCWNHEICSGNLNNQFKKVNEPCCSSQCQLLLLMLKTNGRTNEMYKILSQYKPLIIINKSNSINSNAQIQIKWSKDKLGLGLVCDTNGTAIYLKQNAYVFRTAIAAEGFTSGSHYWEIIADKRTQNELKIGVSTSNIFDKNTAFCDHPFGFAFYGLGQLRHGSNASGSQYGKKFKKEGILGVYLNMSKGILAFSLNGQSMGVAFTDQALTQGPIYPAVSLLHCAGCTIRGQLPIPQYFKRL